MLFNISEVLIMNFGSKFCDFVTSTTRDGKGRKVVFGKGVLEGNCVHCNSYFIPINPAYSTINFLFQ